jgi:hypothetical protein
LVRHGLYSSIDTGAIVTPWWVTLAGSIATFVAGALGAWLAFTSKSREEERLRAALALEADLKTADTFARLMSRAHGRGPDVTLDSVASAVMDSEAGASLLQRAAGGDSDARRELDLLLQLAIRSSGVGEADMDAAMQLIASLAYEYPFLRPAALVGLEGRNVFQPVSYFEDWRQALTGNDPGGTLAALLAKDR